MNLELKIPPPVVAGLIGAGMWGLTRVTSPLAPHSTVTLAFAIAFVAIGFGLSTAGDVEFHRARTTSNPRKPGNASTLVTGGIYRITRNPMYVGALFVLVGLAVYAVNPWTLLGPVAWVAYITRFQIIPEERVLSSRFGEAYTAYRRRVRRWL